MKPGIVGKGKMDVRWHSGVWLGARERSGESIIGTADGCIKVRSIMRKPESDRWKGGEWQSMKGVPWEAVPGHPDRDLKSKVIMPSMEPQAIPEPADPEKQVRRLYINARDIMQYGATACCEGCKAAVRGGESRGHTEECRNRITKAMEDYQDVRASRATQRTTEKLANMMEEMVKNAEGRETAEGHDKIKLDHEVQGPTKAARSGPQPTTSVSSSSSSNNKRKAEGEVEQEERQPSKAIAQEAEDDVEDADMSTLMTLVRQSDEEAIPEEIEGSMPQEWKLKRGIVMDLSSSKEWDFSQRPQRNQVREWIYKYKPLMVVGPSLGVVIRSASGSAEELKQRSVEHQKFMAEVMNIQREGGRKYYHEFPNGASSMDTKEAT